MIIKGAKIVYPDFVREWQVRFDEYTGIISQAGASVITQGESVLDATGLFLLPGLVDCHVHLRDPPGLDGKEDFFTGTTAALAGGVTTVMDMPNTIPPTTSARALEEKAKIAQSKAACDYALHFGATAGNAAESRLVEKSVAGKKIFLGATSFATALGDEGLEEHFRFPKPVLVHAEDAAIVSHNEEEIGKKLGPYATAQVHNSVRPPEAAAKAVSKAIALALKTRCHLHVCHASTAGELELVRQARSRGVNVTCEATPHHLFLNEEATEKLGNFSKVNPPLRSQADVEALWRGIADGTIDCIATDHAPHERKEKERGYWEAPSGVPGLETMLPLLLDACSKKKMALEKIAELCSYNPALKFGLRHKGGVGKGKDADFVLVSLREETVVEEDALYTKCGWSPFAGMRLAGRIRAVFLRGRQVFDGEHLVARPGSGRNLFSPTQI